MKLAALLAVGVLAPGLFLMQATTGATVAVVDFERAIRETPEGKDAIARITALGNEKQAALEAQLKQAADLESQLRTQGAVLSETARVQLTRDLDAARAVAQDIQADAQKQMTQMQQELLGPVEQKTSAAVSAYSAERGIKIVLDASTLGSGLVYVHDTADITSEIIRRIAANVETSGQKNVFVVPGENLPERIHRTLRSRNWFNVNLRTASRDARLTE